MASRTAVSPALRLSRPCASRFHSIARSFASRGKPEQRVRRSAAAPPLVHAAGAAQPIRHYSAPPQQSKVYQFEEVKNFAETPSSDRIIIDVREPAEYAAGYIPGAINVPVVSQPDAFVLPAEEFEERFGFEKPPAEAQLVFYCKAGVRSKAAAKLASQAGWQNVGEYPGSWLDWEKNGGQVDK